MILRTRRIRIALALATLWAAQAYGQGELPLGATVERQLPGDEILTPWVHDPAYVEQQHGDRFEKQEVAGEQLDTVKLTNLVPPIRFDSGVADIPPSTVEQLRQILGSMQDKRNVRLHLVGHADTQPLSPELVERFGDNAGLSRERAGEVAEFLQTTLLLPPESISYEWAGDTQPVASNDTLAGRALNRRVEVEVWYDQVTETVGLQDVLVERPIQRVKVCRMDTVCKLRYVDGHERRARVQNLISPLHYQQETIEVSPTFIERVHQALTNLGDKQNVVVRFVGFTDDTPLAGREERIYATLVGLSSARARRVALAVQDALGLPTAAVESDGRGAEKPLGSNATAQGRALNRRVEVEFWYDDPLQELPDEPQLCPADAGDTLVTRVYDPPWGELAPVLIDDGAPSLPPGLIASLGRAMSDVGDKTHVRLRFVGYTRNERLDRRTAVVYGDDIGLSAARAKRTMELVAAQMALTPEQTELEGRGFLYSDDVVNAGFVQGETSEVKVEVVYDELATLDDYEGVDITRLNQELTPQNPFALNLMRITVDGVPIDDPKRSSADIQRCTDVALDQADIQFGFDDLRARPRLSVAAQPATVGLDDSHGGLVADSPVRFMMYANYTHFIERAEIRIFDSEQSVRETPLEVIAVDPTGLAQWQPSPDRFKTPVRELKYVLRAYGDNGAFDETAAQPLWLTYSNPQWKPVGLWAKPHWGKWDTPKTVAPELDALDTIIVPGTEQPVPFVPAAANVETTDWTPDFLAEILDQLAAPAADTPEAPRLPSPAPAFELAAVPDPRLLGAYGENELAVSNIAPPSGGTVTVRGSRIPADHTVWVAGQQVPVDAQGNFVAEAILPTGMHTVEVAVLDEQGNGDLYLRDLELNRSDWFYVGMADITLAQNSSSGPMELLQGENPDFDINASSYGRLAFYASGKFGDQWKLAASADTREEPLGDLFKDFTKKSPDSLFRRIDPDYYYPTFGDDSIVEQGAPTSGRFYVRLDKGENYGLWGNFVPAYMDNELAQVDRGLYGGMLHYQSGATTSFGEQRLGIDGFVAEPGTIPTREEFRGTGGSLYYLRRQDVLIGSERLRVELRDKTSGIVTGVLNLRPVLDYDIDYLQGRVVLAEPLSSTVADDLLVRSSSVSGDEAYLVVRYEYTPGFEEIDALAVGGQVHYWVGDHVKLGLTANSNEQGDIDSKLGGADVTLRKSAQTWLKLQTGSTEGFITNAVVSNDGGFGFQGYDDASFASAQADARRADLSLGLGDFFEHRDGRLTLYGQELGAGYAAPGLETLNERRNYGGSFRMPVTKQVSIAAKTDALDQAQGVAVKAQELDVAWNVNSYWNLSMGVRDDLRLDDSPLVPLTQDVGERQDVVVQAGYDSGRRWRTYGFVQDTQSVTGNRPENNRAGVGGNYRISEKLTVKAEVSDGNLGRGGLFGTSYIHSERTSLYLNYALENERTDNGLRTYRGSEGKLVAGVKTRFSDSASLFLEERYQDNDATTGLTHAAGISYSPTQKLNLSVNTDIGTLRNLVTNAETERTALAFQVGYGLEAVQFSSGIEYREDNAQQLDLSWRTRTTWLFRNNFKYQLTPAARLLGKLNHSFSESTEGQFYDGGYTEAVLGFGFRPVVNNRLNALAKYTYFYNLPTSEQVTLNGTRAEFLQKSNILSFDLTYDLKPRWTVGGKYAYRVSQASLDRVDPQFFDNGAQLYVLRADWEFKPDWEALFETRLLDMSDIGDRRSGSLIVVSRYLGRHIKAGVGYNFTDFSDDLTDLSYDHKGVFLNLTGAL
jgi:flagellar motor protein MotB